VRFSGSSAVTRPARSELRRASWLPAPCLRARIHSSNRELQATLNRACILGFPVGFRRLCLLWRHFRFARLNSALGRAEGRVPCLQAVVLTESFAHLALRLRIQVPGREFVGVFRGRVGEFWPCCVRPRGPLPHVRKTAEPTAKLGRIARDLAGPLLPPSRQSLVSTCAVVS
jgi:hypothetical protein